jgi:hypothetical protein
MNVFPAAYPRRSRMVGLLAMVVALAALITWIVLATATTGARADVGTASASSSPTGAELQAIRDYHAVGTWGSLTPEQARSIAAYLFGTSDPTPAQLQSIRGYHAFGTWGSLTPAQVGSIRSFLFGVSGR